MNDWKLTCILIAAGLAILGCVADVRYLRDCHKRGKYKVAITTDPDVSNSEAAQHEQNIRFAAAPGKLLPPMPLPLVTRSPFVQYGRVDYRVRCGNPVFQGCL